MNPHGWALALALLMFACSIGGMFGYGTAMFRCTSPVDADRYGNLMILSVVLFFVAFIPLAIWFHYNPCLAGCRMGP